MLRLRAGSNSRISVPYLSTPPRSPTTKLPLSFMAG
jgi:hypothetical protein